VKCSICDENKPKKTIEVDGKKMFVDPKTAKLWNKNECPECSELNLDDPTPKVTDRKCRECNKNLNSGRYFICQECKPELESIDEDHLYEDLDSIEIDEDFFESLEPTAVEFNFMKNKGWKDKKKQEDIILGADQWKPLKSSS